MVSISDSRHGQDFLAQLAHRPAVLVRVESTQGSTPREAGTWMAVFSDASVGTIGGGNLEHQAIAKARAMLGAAPQPPRPAVSMRFALGPSLGQCCGGVVLLRFERVGASDGPALDAWLEGDLTPVALFGAGHVGRALLRVLAPLPFRITWIDSRESMLAESAAAGAMCEHSEPPHAAVAGLAPRSRVLVMSFSHAEDFDVIAACLERQRAKADLPYIGMIGSKTKWRAFQRRLSARGFTPAELARVTCPIGLPGIIGKEPEVIAVAVAAQLLRSLGDAAGTGSAIQHEDMP